MLIFALLAASVCCDVTGQVCFKLGLDTDKEATPRRRTGFLIALLRSRWIIAGILVYVLEFMVWFAALTRAPLSIAVPFAALSYCGIIVASRLVLKEAISPRRWAATLVVAAGVAIVCWPAVG